ncbi:MAG: hypothetical protein F9K40_03105 [Kofleriaceae bacterium]|nr:MAG: hypothetical protein F9K40_03105 [Kofleriaceae bacterium]
MTTLRELPGMQGDDALVVQAIRESFICRRVGAEAVTIGSTRKERMAARLALYRDDFLPAVEKLIDVVWEHKDVKGDRRKLAELVGFLNVAKRVTDEVASLYNEPAKREFPTPEQTAAFQKIERELQLHATMKEAHRLSFWMNDVLLWLMSKPDGKRSLRIITPDAFEVVVNPADKLEPVAYILDCAPAWVPPSLFPDRSSLPHYEVWDSQIAFTLNANGFLIGDVREHRLGRIPGVLVSSRLPVDRLLDDRPGRDLESAAKAVLFLNILTLALSQTSGEQQPYLRGQLSEMAADQPQSAGRPIALPPGVEAGVLDLVTDPEHLLKVIKHVIGSVAQSYGMSYEQFTFQETADTASGKAYTVRRQKLTELRKEQRGRAEIYEPQVAELIFGTSDGLTVDYHDQAAPMDPLEEHELFVARMNRGLDNPLAKMKRENPDLTDEAAEKKLLGNVAVVSWFYSLLRANNISLDATTATPGKTPEDNGRSAQERSSGGDGDGTRTATEGDDTATAA